MRLVDLSEIEEDPTLTDPSKELLLRLHADPMLNLRCIFDGSPAIVFRQMVAGCIALPDTVEQTLCAQHDIGRTPLGDLPGGDDYVVDLSVGGQWSRYLGDEPRYVIYPDEGLVHWCSVR
ncbi:hypothetical protein KC992_02860 [Candidatus Saccharibacteria bacterium]|nr:hypothetical protein [Candidatus Saccharibacteria bacterium]